jgi:hypothetical protein
MVDSKLSRPRSLTAAPRQSEASLASAVPRAQALSMGDRETGGSADRHAAITQTLRKYANYKQWVESVRDSWTVTNPKL